MLDTIAPFCRESSHSDVIIYVHTCEQDEQDTSRFHVNFGCFTAAIQKNITRTSINLNISPPPDEQPHGAPKSTERNCQADVW